MRTIYRYPLKRVERQDITGPGLSRVVSVSRERGEIEVWAEIDTQQPMNTIQIVLVGTGQPHMDKFETDYYIGHVIEGQYVWHLYASPDTQLRAVDRNQHIVDRVVANATSGKPDVEVDLDDDAGGAAAADPVEDLADEFARTLAGNERIGGAWSVDPKAWRDMALALARRAHGALGQGVKPSWDAEDCDACTEAQDLCRYHQGVTDGASWVSERLAAIATDPELLNLIPARAIEAGKATDPVEEKAEALAKAAYPGVSFDVQTTVSDVCRRLARAGVTLPGQEAKR